MKELKEIREQAFHRYHLRPNYILWMFTKVSIHDIFSMQTALEHLFKSLTWILEPMISLDVFYLRTVDKRKIYICTRVFWTLIRSFIHLNSYRRYGIRRLRDKIHFVFG